MKLEYGYRFFPEAYAALQALCDDYFPTSRAFYEKAKELLDDMIGRGDYVEDKVPMYYLYELVMDGRS